MNIELGPINLENYEYKLLHCTWGKELRFSVIYSFDISKENGVKGWQPPNLKAWTLTEKDEESISEEMRHRKYCRILTLKSFFNFVERIGLVPQDIETMGSIGAPGFGFGWAPAISFEREYCGYGDEPLCCSAYVTPWIDNEYFEGTDQNFKILRKWILYYFAN